MSVEARVAENAVISPEGCIDITNSHELWEKLTFLCETGCKDITIDFAHVARIDCSGLGKLLLAQKRLKESRGGLKLINVTNPYVRKLFTLVQLEKVITVEGNN